MGTCPLCRLAAPHPTAASILVLTAAPGSTPRVLTVSRLRTPALRLPPPRPPSGCIPRTSIGLPATC